MTTIMAPSSKKESQLEKALRQIYFRPGRSGSFGGINALLRAYLDSRPNGKRGHEKNLRRRVGEWLSRQDTYTLHKPVVRRFRRSRVVVGGIDDQWQADLVDVSTLMRHNDGFKYLLTCIDVFSKFAWAVPLKDKSGKSLVTAFKDHILKSSGGRKPRTLQTDKGSEFTNRLFQSFLKKENIAFFTTHNEEIKAGICERFNRTLKSRMWRFFTKSDDLRYIDILDELIKSYNNTYHRSIGTRPNAVNQSNQEEVWLRLYHHDRPLSKSNVRRFVLKVGDTVRISKTKRTFKKGYLQNWSEELFIVSKILRSRPKRYQLRDYNGEVLRGSFYENELQKVIKDSNVYKIENILEERGSGRKKEILVKWLGYPATFNSWIMKKDLMKYYKE